MLRLPALLIPFFALLATPASAQIHVYTYEGTVTSQTLPAGTAYASVAVGSPFSVSFTVDLTNPPSNPLPNDLLWVNTGILDAVTVEIDGIHRSLVTTGSKFAIENDLNANPCTDLLQMEAISSDPDVEVLSVIMQASEVSPNCPDVFPPADLPSVIDLDVFNFHNFLFIQSPGSGSGQSLTGQLSRADVKVLETAGNALLFDGVDDICTIVDSNDDFDLGAAFTVEAWVRHDEVQALEGFVSGPFGYTLATSGNHALMSVSAPAINTALSTFQAAPLGVWTHVAGTYDGADIRLYVNGQLNAMTAHPGSSGAVTEVIFGRYGLAANFADGALDEVRLWNRVRTPEEISGNYCRSLCGAHPGLVGNYKFDEPAGQEVRDSSPAGNHGVLGDSGVVEANDPMRVPSDVLVVYEGGGGALEFDGLDDFSTVIDDNDDFDLGAAMTVEAWVRLDVVGAINSLVGGDFAYNLVSNANDPAFTATIGSSEGAVAPGALVTGEWTHLAGTFDGSDLKLFLNGTLVSTQAHPGATPDVARLFFGRFGTTSTYTAGALDEVRIWNYARSDTEILEHYRVGLGGDEIGLVGYYRFDEEGGQLIGDSSAYDNHGTLGADIASAVDDPARVTSGVSLCLEPLVYRDLCNGDGGDQMGCTDCPCGNNAPAGLIGGCMHSASMSLFGGAGSRLIAEGDSSVSLPPSSTTDLKLSMANMPPVSTAVMFSGGGVAPQNMANPCFGRGVAVDLMNAGAKDGLRCATGGLLRHGNRQSDSNGNIADDLGPSRTWGGTAGPINGLAFQSGFTAGQTRYFQATHRDLDTAQCMTGLNTSQAVEVTFTP